MQQLYYIGYLKHPEYPHDADQSQHLADPAHHQRVLHPLQNEAEVVGKDGKDVDHV